VFDPEAMKGREKEEEEHGFEVDYREIFFADGGSFCAPI